MYENVLAEFVNAFGKIQIGGAELGDLTEPDLVQLTRVSIQAARISFFGDQIDSCCQEDEDGRRAKADPSATYYLRGQNTPLANRVVPLPLKL